MKSRLLIIIGIIAIGMISVFMINNGHDLFHYMNLPYEWHDSFRFTDTNIVRSAQCASEELAWLEPCIDVKTVSDNTPEQLEAILEYCIDSKDLIDTIGLSYYNSTHSIDTITCEWQKYNGVQIDSEGFDSGWITGEDYCHEWCANDELYQMGCDQPILAHLTKHSNLLDEEFHGKYVIEDEGLPDGVSTEKFQECVDYIYEKRILMEPERLDQVLHLCENTDAQYLGALSFENSTHHIDSQTCTWRLLNEN